MLVDQSIEDPPGQVAALGDLVVAILIVRFRRGAVIQAPHLDLAWLSVEPELEGTAPSAVEDQEAELVDGKAEILDLLDVER